MVVGTLNKETKKLHVTFNGAEVICPLVKIPASKDKSANQDGYWIHVEKLGAGRKWLTLKSLGDAEETIEFDETQAREITIKRSRMISMSNIKEFLTDEQVVVYEELLSAAETERDRREAEAAANAPVKEKTSKAMTPEQKLAKLKAEQAKLEAQIRGEIPMEEPKAKKTKAKKVEIENLDN